MHSDHSVFLEIFIISPSLFCIKRVKTFCFYFGYKLKTINEKEISRCLTEKKVPDAMSKGIIQWLKSSQSMQYSQNKSDWSRHSAADSLRRILMNLIKERQKK